MQQKKNLQIAKEKEVDTVVVGSRGFSTAEEFPFGKCVAQNKSSCKMLSSYCEIRYNIQQDFVLLLFMSLASDRCLAET